MTKSSATKSSATRRAASSAAGSSGVGSRTPADRVMALLNGALTVDDVLLLALLQVAQDEQRRDVVWLALALLYPQLPVTVDVKRAYRQLLLDGPASVLAAENARTSQAQAAEPGQPAPPAPLLHDRLVHHQTLVDVHHTLLFSAANQSGHQTGHQTGAGSQTSTGTGIGRVVTESLRRWSATQTFRPIGWTEEFAGLRDLTAAERDGAGLGPGRPQPTWALVPWQCRYLLPEVIVEVPQLQRLTAMIESGAVRLTAIGYDLIPVTAAETSRRNLPGAFAAYLGVLRYADTLAAISRSAATEFRGFCAMLIGQGLAGPRVVEVPLPSEVVAVDAAAVASARARLGIGDTPLVLAVGTQEPRKNHLALLHAAELLWRDGVVFCLVLLGQVGWGSREFLARCAELQAAGRPLSLVNNADDDLLWGSYHAARVMAYPSLHDGFGLPVAEALACGTPVVTSNIGSMLQLASEGGALAVYPYDDRALAEALRAVLTDDELHTRLSAEARARVVRTWDDYAAQVWQVLTEPAPLEPLP